MAAQRIEDGRLTIVFQDPQWDMIVLSDVASKQALRKCHKLLEQIRSGLHLPPTSSPVDDSRSPSGEPSKSLVVKNRQSAKKKLHVGLNNRLALT